VIASHVVMTLRVVVNALRHQRASVSVPSRATFPVRSKPNAFDGGPTANAAADGRDGRWHHSSVVGHEPAVLDQKDYEMRGARLVLPGPLCWFVLVATTFMTHDHITVGAAIADRNFPAPSVVTIAFMPMAPVLVAIGADAGRSDAGMSSS
jgi:hypothetical protein